jgi:hypothetical protein
VSGRVRIDWWPAARIAELQAFFEEHWQRGHILARDAQLLRWQYRRPGDPQRLSMLVASEDDRIVGALGLIVVSFCVRGRRSCGGWLATWIATPAAREQQVGLRLLQRVLDEPLGFVGVIGINETVLGIYRALGFSICERVPRWVRTISDDALATLLGDCAPARGALPATPAAGLPLVSHTPQISHTPGVSREPWVSQRSSDSLRISAWSNALAKRWDAIWSQRLAPGLVGTWRDADYLRWRYLEHPHFTYAVRVAEDSKGALRGLAVHRIAEVQGAVGRAVRIVELLGDAEAVTALAANAVAAGVRTGAAFADFYCTAAGVAEPLEACGFTLESERSEALPALFEPLDLGTPRLTGAFRMGGELGGELGGDPTPLDPQALYVTRSDGDQDRPNLAARNGNIGPATRT